MAITFDQIPSNLRLPGTRVEVSASGAVRGIGDFPVKVLVLGQKLSTGSATAEVPVQVFDAAQAVGLFGQHSQLARMFAALKKADPWTPTYAIPLADAAAGVAATGTITIGGSPTAAGTLSVLIGGRRVRIAVAASEAVGTTKAKDLILGWAQEGGRVRLDGHGPGRMHWPENIRADFYEQLLSEIKIPGRLNPKRRAWKSRTDRRNEALDCTVYALYLSRHLRLHLRRPAHWDLAELRLRQISIIPETLAEEEPAPPAAEPPAAAPVQTSAAPAAPPPATPAATLAQAHLTQMLRARAAQRHGQRR
jgi:hypothetical protein